MDQYDCVILNQNYDIDLLRKDCEKAINHTDFTIRKAVKGASVSLFRDTIGWSSIPLHSIDGIEGNEGNILRTLSDDVVFKSTPCLKKCSYFKKILKDLNTEIYLVRLMKLKANGYIAPHNDGAQFYDRRKMIRCHIPIYTNKNVNFGVGEKEYYLDRCKLWYTRVDKLHWVKNNSDEDRIHLVIDIRPTLKIMENIGLTDISLYEKFYFQNTDFNDKIKFSKINNTINPQSDICLIMCQWKRYHTLENILKTIEKQTISVDIYLWNNNYDTKDELDEILEKFKYSHLNIYLHNSKHNIKCQGRLITANILRYIYKNIIFLDDDEVMDNEYVIETFKNEVEKYPNTIFSIWALDFLSPNKFYNRKRKGNNELANYAGGGGAIYPSNLFSNKFLEWLPKMFFNVEDFLCNIFISKYMDGNNRASNAKISFIPNEYDSKDSMSWGEKYCDRTGIEIHELKNKCLQWAVENYNYPIIFDNSKNLKIIVPFYNVDPKLLYECLESIKNQTYVNYSVCIIDDASNDSDERVEIINSYLNNPNWYIIKQKVNGGPLVSRDVGIRKMCNNDSDIIVLIDGDDKLAHNKVFERIIKEYEKDIYLTFGNFKTSNNIICWDLDIVNWEKVIEENKYREVCQPEYWDELLISKKNTAFKFPFAPIRTFKFFLYSKIKDKDLRDMDNNYDKYATDKTIMLPMLEMSGGKFSYINEILYIYNNNNGNNTHTDPNNWNLQTRQSLYVNKLSKYTSLFRENKFDKNNLYTVWKKFNNDDEDLFILFSNDNNWNSLNEFYDLFVDKNVLFLRDTNCHWYINGIPGCSSNIIETIDFLKEKIKEFECTNITTVGYREGGYAAILYGHYIKANKIIVFDPVTYLDNKTRNSKNDTRWDNDEYLKEFNKSNIKQLNLKKLGISKCNKDIKVIYSNNSLDKSHYNNLKRNKNFNVTGVKINTNDNNLCKYLERNKMLSNFF